MLSCLSVSTTNFTSCSLLSYVCGILTLVCRLLLLQLIVCDINICKNYLFIIIIITGYLCLREALDTWRTCKCANVLFSVQISHNSLGVVCIAQLAPVDAHVVEGVFRMVPVEEHHCSSTSLQRTSIHLNEPKTRLNFRHKQRANESFSTHFFEIKWIIHCRSRAKNL